MPRCERAAVWRRKYPCGVGATLPSKVERLNLIVRVMELERQLPSHHRSLNTSQLTTPQIREQVHHLELLVESWRLVHPENATA